MEALDAAALLSAHALAPSTTLTAPPAELFAKYETAPRRGALAEGHGWMWIESNGRNNGAIEHNANNQPQDLTVNN